MAGSKSEEVVIRVDHVSKDFVLPQEKITTVKGLFTSALRHRGKKKSTQHALQDVSFDVKKGEFFGIVGRNGSGKSTMLKMLAGIYQPTKGSIETKGKLVPFIELGVGFNPELTGRENVYLNGAMMGFSEKETEAMYNEIVAFAELEAFMDQKLKNYSSGMQVRLAFSVAVKAEADILVVDEVLAVGDTDFQRKCFDYFRSLKRDNKTVVFVSHDMNSVREFCDRAILIEKSKLVAGGKSDAVAAKYSQLFLDSDYMAENAAKGGSRWGTGAVRISSVSLKKRVLTDEDEVLEFTTTLEGVGSNEALMTGFTLRNGTGEAVHGTNTWIKKMVLPLLTKAEKCQVTWTCPNIYADGRYYVEVYAYGAGNIVYDSWEDAANFVVKRIERQRFSIEPTVDVTVRTSES
jgi:ABC-2 type transport system ATP-binding protein